MRNRDHRGRFRGNTKQQKEETSTQKEIETETGTLAEETIEKNIESGIEQTKIGLEGDNTTREELKPFIISPPKPGNTTYQQIQIPDDPNSVDIVNPEKVQAIFRNPDTIVSQITTTIVESKVIGSSKEPIGDSNSIKENPERWDFTPSPKKDQIAYTIFGNPFNMAERGRELDRRE